MMQPDAGIDSDSFVCYILASSHKIQRLAIESRYFPCHKFDTTQSAVMYCEIRMNARCKERA